MKNKNLFLIISFLLITVSCSNVQVIETGSRATIKLPPKEPKEIKIYRSSRPQWSIQEIGVVTVRGINDIKVVYEKMRLEAGKRGADAVIDFDMDSEVKLIPATSTSCAPGGACTTITTMTSQVFYTASGALVHKKEELK
ncbi:MAG: hypothetical protein IMY67_08075 [Bacteroidetes bacterium]|nr:hypothetical protein [Bacteroidota bacterium]